MYQRKNIYGFGKWKHKLYVVSLSGIMCFVLMCMQVIALGVSIVHADGVPGGNVGDPVVRAVDIAKPAVVRIITQVVGKLTVTFSNGQSVTFPQTPQNGFDGYPLDLSGTGAFISAHGDILTADHVVHPVEDDKQALDQALQQMAAPDIATYIRQHFNQQVTADQVAQELASGQLPSTSQYGNKISRAYLSTHFSGPLNVPDFSSIPPSQYADVDQIKEYSLFSAQDIAIIHVSGKNDMPMLQLGDSSSVQQQDQLTIIGFPGNGDVGTSPTDLLTSSINQVTVSSIKTTNGGSQVIQVSGNVEHGDSGGPALNSDGNVVGIVSFGTDPANGGNTSFLRTSNSATQLIKKAGIDTTPSPLQKAWSKAFNDYASQIPGHWHQSTQEFQQIVGQYPQFKAVNQFLRYASQQAQTETVTQEQQTGNSNSSSPATGSNGLNPVYIVGGGAALLLIIVLGVAVLAMSRRRPAASSASLAAPGQLPVTPAALPTYPPNWQQPPYISSLGQAPPSFPSSQQGVYQSSPQQGVYQPQLVPPSNNVSAFGAPLPSTPPSASASVTGIRAPAWQTWPCGHTNRQDARFCGVCGEPSSQR
jgi:S1-C subfamily serine protease